MANTTTHITYEGATCTCGAEPQTHEHRAFEFQTYEKHWNIIDEGASDYRLAKPFDTKAGINALAELVKMSKAIQKQKARAILLTLPAAKQSDQRAIHHKLEL